MEAIINETRLVAGNVHKMLHMRGLTAQELTESAFSEAVFKGVIQLEALDAKKKPALYLLIFPRESKFTESKPVMEPLLRSFFAGKTAPVMIIYYQLRHSVSKLLREFRHRKGVTIEIHRDEIFLQAPDWSITPKHEIVRDLEPLTQRFGEEFQKHLGKIYTGDKMAVWLNATPNDVVRIIYSSASSGTEEQFLVVVPGDPMLSQRMLSADDEDEDVEVGDVDDADDVPQEAEVEELPEE